MVRGLKHVFLFPRRFFIVKMQKSTPEETREMEPRSCTPFSRLWFAFVHRKRYILGMAFQFIRALAFALLLPLHLEAISPSSSVPEEKSGLLLANVWSPAIDPTGWWISEKYDGVRGFWDGQRLKTRNGNTIHAPDYFIEGLPKNIPLDGELWLGRGKFEETSSIVLSDKPDERWRHIRFMIFDAPNAPGSFEERVSFLTSLIPATHPFLKAVAQDRCRNTAHLIAERDRIVALGGEGLMIRKPESAYEKGRSPTLLKVKPSEDAEATVTGYVPGKGRYEGMTGSLRVRTIDGKEFSIGAGLTDAQRSNPPPIGAVITYRFRGMTSKGLPRFPSFLRVRTDAGK
jgi:DNA ligase 1